MLEEDLDIGPDEVYIKGWTNTSTQTPRDDLYEEAAKIVQNYDAIEKYWKKRQLREENLKKYLLSTIVSGFGIGVGIAFGSVLAFTFLRIFKDE